MKSIILKYTLQNAIKYNKAELKAVLSKIFSEIKVEDKKEVVEEAKKIINEVNKLSKEERLEKLNKIAPELLEKREVKEREILKLKKPVMRFAPNPNGAISLGHARTALWNWFLVKENKGKWILRYDDTDAKIKTPIKEAYKWIEDDLKWLGVKISKKVRQSSRLNTYYKYALNLIKKNKAYVCSCKTEDWRDKCLRKEACGCRNLNVKEQLKRWKLMFSKYKEGEAILRIKTDLNHENPAVRDWPAFRIVDKPKHPFSKEKVWPLLNFASAIDDYKLKVTHILRGIDLQVSDVRQKYIYDYFNWKYPKTIYHGKFKIKGIKSTSEIRKLIDSKKIKGWDDTRLGTIMALRKRGFCKEAINEFIKNAGLTKQDVDVSFEGLAAINRKILDKKANRYFFVANPKKIKIKNDVKSIKIPIHPDKKVCRNFKITDEFYIEDKIKKGKLYRLIGLFNFKDNKFISKKVDKSASLIHWVPAKENIKVEVLMDDGSLVKGLGEKNLEKVRVDEVVQFVRIGFFRLDKKEKNKLVFRFGHK